MGNKPLSSMWGSTRMQQQEQLCQIPEQDLRGKEEKASGESDMPQDERRRKREGVLTTAAKPSCTMEGVCLLQQRQQGERATAASAPVGACCRNTNILLDQKEKNSAAEAAAPSSASATIPQPASSAAGVISENEFPPLSASISSRHNSSAREGHAFRLCFSQPRQNSNNSSSNKDNSLKDNSSYGSSNRGLNSSTDSNTGEKRSVPLESRHSSNAREHSNNGDTDSKPGERQWLAAAKAASSTRPASLVPAAAAGRNSWNTRFFNASSTSKAYPPSFSSSARSPSQDPCGSSRGDAGAQISGITSVRCSSSNSNRSSCSSDEDRGEWKDSRECLSSNSSCQERGSTQSSRQTSKCGDSNSKNFSSANCVTAPTHENVVAVTCHSSSCSSSAPSSSKKQHLYGRKGDGEEGTDDAATTPSSRCSTCSSSCCCHTPSQRSNAISRKQDVPTCFAIGRYIPVTGAGCESPATPRPLQRRKSDVPVTSVAATLPRLLSGSAAEQFDRRWYTAGAAGRRGSAGQARWYTPATAATHVIPAPPPEPFVTGIDRMSGVAAREGAPGRQRGSAAATAAIASVTSLAADTTQETFPAGAEPTARWSISGVGRGGGAMLKADARTAAGWHGGRRRRSSYTQFCWGGATGVGMCKMSCYSNTCNRSTYNGSPCNSSPCNSSGCSSCCFALCCCYCCYCINGKVLPGEKRRLYSYAASPATAGFHTGCCLTPNDTAGNVCVASVAADEGGGTSGNSCEDSTACCYAPPTMTTAPPPPHAEHSSSTYITEEGGSRRGHGATIEAVVDPSNTSSEPNCRSNNNGGYSQNNYGFSSNRQHYYKGRYKGVGSNNMCYQQQYGRKRHFQQGNGGETWCSSTERGRGGHYTGVRSSSKYHNSNSSNDSKKHLYSSYSIHKSRSSCGVSKSVSTRAQEGIGSFSQTSGSSSVLSDGRWDDSTNGRVSSKMTRSSCIDPRTSPACSLSNDKTISETGTTGWERRRQFIDSAETREQQKWITQVVAQTDVKSLPDYFTMQLAANLGGGRAAAAAFQSASFSHTSSTWTDALPHAFSAVVGHRAVQSTAALAATSFSGIASALPPGGGSASSDAVGAAALADQALRGENVFFLQHPPLQQPQNISRCDGSCFGNHSKLESPNVAAAAAGAKAGENCLPSGLQQTPFENVIIPAAVSDECSLCSSPPYTESQLQQQQQLGAAMLLGCPSSPDSAPLLLPRHNLSGQHKPHQQLLEAAAAALEFSPYPELNDAATAQQVLNEARKRSCCPPMDSATAAAAYLLKCDEERQNALQQRWFDWQQQQILLQQQLQTYEAEPVHQGHLLHLSGEDQEQGQQQVDDSAQQHEQQAKQIQQSFNGQEQQQKSLCVTQHHQAIPQQQQETALLKEQNQLCEADKSGEESKSGTKLFCFNPQATEFIPAHLQSEQRKKSIVNASAPKHVDLRIAPPGDALTCMAALQIARSAATEAAVTQAGTDATGSTAVEDTSGTEKAIETMLPATSERDASHVNAEGCLIHPPRAVSREATEIQQRHELHFIKREEAASDSFRGEADSRTCLQQRTRGSQSTTISAALSTDGCSVGAADAPAMPSASRITSVEAEQQQCGSSAAEGAAVGQLQQQHRQHSHDQQQKENHHWQQRVQGEEPTDEVGNAEVTDQAELPKKQRAAELLQQQLQQRRRKQHSEDLVLDITLVKQTSLHQQQHAEVEPQGNQNSRSTGEAAAGWKPAAANDHGVNEEEEEAETCTSSNSNTSVNWCPDIPLSSPRVRGGTAFLSALSGAALPAGAAQTARAEVIDAPDAERDDVGRSACAAMLTAGGCVEDTSEIKRSV